MNKLIVNHGLLEPPSQNLAIYHLFLCSKYDLKLDILILSNKEIIDFVYKDLKIKGLYGLTNYILTPEEKECGIRLDNEESNPPLIKIKAIVFENEEKILNLIKEYV